MYSNTVCWPPMRDACVCSPVPSGYSEISNIAVDQPGRRLYNVRGPSEVVSILLQIDASEGNKVMTVRSPLQVLFPFRSSLTPYL